MNTPEPFETDEALEQQAANWLFERDDGFVAERATAFAQWCQRDMRHAAAVSRVETTMSLLDAMPTARAPFAARLASVAESSAAETGARKIHHVGLWTWTNGLAAALVLGALMWWLVPAEAPKMKTYAAEANSGRRVALSDGSIVDLNANSRVQVQFLAKKREVILAQGEAHFQVAHDATHPFTVTAHGITVRAVGTAFNVRLQDGNVDVLVTEGKVTIERRAGATNSAEVTPILPLLSAGERTHVIAGSVSMPQIESVATTAVHGLLSWQDRMTTFSDVPLREMLTRINRCNVTQLVLGDPDLGDRKIGGVIDLNQVNAFVQMLEQDGDIVAERRSNEIVLRHAH